MRSPVLFMILLGLVCLGIVSRDLIAARSGAFWYLLAAILLILAACLVLLLRPQ